MQFGRLRIILATGAVIAALLLLLIGQGLLAFTDLGSHWAASAVAALQARGLIAGYPDGSFDPGRLLSRSELAKLLAVALNQETDASALAGIDTRFPDVPGGHWAAGYVEVLAELGLVRGDAVGNFEPDRPVTRAELAVLLARAAGLQNEPANPDYLRYLDLAAIPEWARGAVGASTRTGLLTGDAAGTFRPLDGVTRAEAAAALLRLLAYRGAAFQLVGVFLTYDPGTRRMALRDLTGQTRTVTLASDAVIFRQGAPAAPGDLLAADQVWVYMGTDGLVRYVDARFRSNWGTEAQVDKGRLRFTAGTGPVQVAVQPGALIFVNGRAASLADVNGARRVYVGLDAATGEARLIDAVFYKDAGMVQGVNIAQRSLAVGRPDGKTQTYPVSDSAMVFRNGLRAALKDLVPGDQVLLQLDASGSLTYVQAERQPG